MRDIALLEKMTPCNSREAVVSVLSYEDGRLEGNLQHPRLRAGEELKSLSHMVLLLNSLIDMEKCPNAPPPLIKTDSSGQDGATVFRIQILFREHYTWQGRLVWQNQNKEFAFRSTIELFQLLDEILAE